MLPGCSSKSQRIDASTLKSQLTWKKICWDIRKCSQLQGENAGSAFVMFTTSRPFDELRQRRGLQIAPFEIRTLMKDLYIFTVFDLREPLDSPK